jgi:glycosyltransferase involved in cell wall biosynthesis
VAQTRGHDVCVAGFLGQPLAVWLSLFQRRPIVLDAFISLYDTLCFDRRVAPPESPVGRLAFSLDRKAAAAAAVVVVDTLAHAEYFSKTFLIPRQKIETIYVGYDPEVFVQLPHVQSDGSRCHVFSYSSFLPVHGMDHIVRAAQLLRSEPRIDFTVVGTGPTHSAVRRLATQLDLPNVTFIDWLPYQQLPAAVAAADICLGGHFATTEKARRTIAGKTFQFLAMGRPTIVGDCAANRELMVPGEHAVFCQQGSPEALAEAIADLARSPGMRQHVGAKGQVLVQQRFHPESVRDLWAAAVERALALGHRQR